MEDIHYSIVIDAPKERVWDAMLGKDTYPLWTDVFMPGSYFKGDWSEGSKIIFLAPDEAGGELGMISRVKENREYEFISLESVGVVHNDKEDTTSPEAKMWAGSFENYTFKEVDGKTEVQVDLTSDEGISDEDLEMFDEMWRQALDKLKKLAEK